ncbi:MAG: hypothetical protein WD671_05220 [Parvibaculum sp.]
MKIVRTVAALAVTFSFAAACSESESYTQETVVAPSPFHGIHGLTVTPDGRLLAGSVVGRALYEVNRDTGETSIAEGPPEGMADDVEQGPDGTIAWTAFLDGKVYARKSDGRLLTLAEGLPGMNSLAWTDDGRLFATQVFLGDALYELDPSGANPPRKIMEGMGGLNGFDFGPDGKLYGPLWFKKQIVRVDVETATIETVATGFDVPAAANFDSKGNLYAVDTAAGHVYRIDVASGEKTLISEVAPAIDNLALDADDNLYITNMADNAVIAIDTDTGEARTIVSGALAVAGDIEMSDAGTLYVADLFAARMVDPASGEVTELGRVFASEIDYPLSVSVANGRIAFAALTAGAVHLFDEQTGASLGIHHGFTTPAEALALSDGSVLVTEYTRGAIVRVDGDDWSNRTDLATGLSGPATMKLGLDGSLYVSERTGGRISRVDLESGESTVIAEGLAEPEGFDIAPDGRIIVAEVGAKRISAINPAGGEPTVLKSDLPIGFEAPDGAPDLYIPTGIAVAANGDIYYSSDIDVAIYRLKKD